MPNHIILDFIKKHKIAYIIGIIFMLLSSFIQTLFPKVLGNTIDIMKIDGFNKYSVITNIIYIILIAAGAFFCTFTWRNLVIANARKLECELREKLFSHFQELSPEFYSERKTGDLISYAINDISAVRMTFGPATAMSINGIALCIISIYSMYQAINWRLTLMTLLPIPVILVFTFNVGKLIKIKFTKVQESFSAISDKVQENIYGIRVIKAFVQEKNEIKHFEKLNNQITDANLSMVRTSSLLTPVIEFCFSISFVMNLIIGGKMVLENKITLGDFIAFNTYLTMIINPIISVGRVINIYQRGMASLSRLNELFNVKPKITDTAEMKTVKIDGEIEFKNLNFSYPGSNEKALKNVNLRIPRGHTLGIVGKTGSGKSTLANILFKLYNVEHDKVFIDGTDIMNIPLQNLRNSFGLVPQDNFLFSASIKDNITFFKNIYSAGDIELAAKNSCIYNKIMEFKDNFNTILGERGVNLSGGQKQRVAIARALIKNPAVLVLDDSLSAVDTLTEKQILANLKKIRTGKTNIIIAHRISAVKDADEIILLDNGRICERGTHSQLVNERGQYYDIFTEQCESSKKQFEAS